MLRSRMQFPVKFIVLFIEAFCGSGMKRDYGTNGNNGKNGNTLKFPFFPFVP